MLDRYARKLIDPAFNTLGPMVARTGVSANTLTLVGLGIGIGAAAAVALHAFHLALLMLLANRFLDGLDGAVARASASAARAGPTEFGGYLDIVSDFFVWALLPLGFAVADPANTLPAAMLLASFVATGTTFLAYAILAEKGGHKTTARGEKSFFHLGGLTEGAETIGFFVIVMAWPSLFPVLASIFAGLAAITAIMRVWEAWRVYGPRR